MKTIATIIRDALGEAKPINRPLFSIIHPSARPDKWRAVYDAWMKACVNPDDVEYVLVMDERWGFDKKNAFSTSNCRIIFNEGRRCYVDAVNAGAKASTGRILIVIADDQFPCERWDEEIHRAVVSQPFYDVMFALSVSTNTPQEHERGLIVMPILSRARYEKLGYVFYPEYESMYADNDFCEHAKADGVLIEARHLLFDHRHPLNDLSVKWDAAYDAQNRQPAYTLGESLIKRRREAKFQGIAPEAAAGPPSIAVCLPGETFSHHWVCAWTILLAHLVQRGFNVHPCFNFTSNVYFTRQACVEMAKQANASFLLWIDDDQILTPENFDRLYERILSGLDMVAGWTWISDEAETTWCVSCGKYSADDSMVTHVPQSEMERVQALGQLIDVEWTGFPVVLMRSEVADKASEVARQRIGSPNSFAPFPAPASKWGLTGEDVSFCLNAKRAGFKVYVDSRVFIPHLKLRSVKPEPSKQTTAPLVESPVEHLEYTGV